MGRQRATDVLEPRSEQNATNTRQLRRAVEVEDADRRQHSWLNTVGRVVSRAQLAKRVTFEGKKIPLAQFDLIEPIGRGGMGQVWLGVHREQSIPVAIKVLSPSATRDAESRRRFRVEVRAIARLDHPAIIRVYDFGEIERDTERLSGGKLQGGSPYLVMELGSGGSLEHFKPKNWDEVYPAFKCLLGALAHAHARGVIHRDIKPGNVLFSSQQRVPDRLKLTDFGIAQALAIDRAVDRSVLGTPSYMAPEQLLGRFRDQGPWTDLYSLGCLAWRLIVGRRPYPPPPNAGSETAVLVAQWLRSPLRRFEPRFSVPARLEQWLERLLERQPTDRFQCAADAANQLHALVSQSSLSLTPLLSAKLDAPMTSRALLATGRPLLGAEGPLLEDSEALALNTTDPNTGRRPPNHDHDIAATVVGWCGHSAAVPPMPATWYRPDGNRARTLPRGGGQALFGLRTLSMTGRLAERQLLWDALGRVRDTGRTSLVVVKGPAGTGKSRLAQWLAERATEVGCATVLKAQHSRVAGAAGGLGRMVGDYLGCADLSHVESKGRIERLLASAAAADGEFDHPGCTDLVLPHDAVDQYELDTITALASPHLRQSKNGHGVFRFSNPAERFATLRRLLERPCRRRPVLLWLDDVQWGSESLALANFLMRSQKTNPLPLLLLLTVRHEALLDRALESGLLAELEALPSAQTIELAHLSESDTRKLVSSMLDLSDSLTEDVCRRCGGHPLFAVQLVGDWVERRLLEPSETGFRLREAADLRLPDSLHALWAGRLGEALATLDQAADPLWRVLELTAILGEEVRPPEWTALGRRAEVSLEELEEVLLRRGLFETHHDNLAFVHGMLRESLVRRATESGRHRQHHLDCAELIAHIYPKGAQHREERLGVHLLDGGAADEAIAPLTEAANGRRLASEYPQAHRVLDLLDRAILEADLPEDDVRRGEAQILRAGVYRIEWKLEPAEVSARAAAAAAQKHGWLKVEADALFQLVHILRLTGHLADAYELSDRVIVYNEQLDDELGVANAVISQAILAREEGDAERSMMIYRMAMERFERIDDVRGLAFSHLGMGHCDLQLARWDRAESHYQKAQELFEALGERVELAGCLNSMAELARNRGLYPEAEETYRRARALYRVVGSEAYIVPQINLGLSLADRGNLGEALTEFTWALPFLEASGHRAIRGAVLSFMLPCLAEASKWDRFDEVLTQATQLLDESMKADRDVAKAAQRAADILVACGDTGRAASTYRLALSQWRALEDDQGEITALRRLRLLEE